MKFPLDPSSSMHRKHLLLRLLLVLSVAGAALFCIRSYLLNASSTSIAGVLVDGKTGSPISGATIFVAQRDATFHGPLLRRARSAETSTGVDGHFSLTLVANDLQTTANIYVLVAVAKGYQPILTRLDKSQVEVSTSREPIEVKARLQRSQELQNNALDEVVAELKNLYSGVPHCLAVEAAGLVSFLSEAHVKEFSNLTQAQGPKKTCNP